MPDKTFQQYDKALKACRNVFMAKMHDYGTAWRILRSTSITDQIYIKASRIRSIEEKGESKVDEGVKPEFIGMINYSVMALIQLEMGSVEDAHMDEALVGTKYDSYVAMARNLMADKNHDYGGDDESNDDDGDRIEKSRFDLRFDGDHLFLIRCQSIK